ncbi:MAG: hypothetical protein DRN92_03485 [Thermoproteota archaeon]|nr:MAG: hypothetical protein DRN92_03485 [Candidatus Korarchaeota archaeon]
MEKIKITIGIVSAIVTIFVIAYLMTLPRAVLEEFNWVSIVALLFLYWIIFVNWYSKHKRETP